MGLGGGIAVDQPATPADRHISGGLQNAAEDRIFQRASGAQRDAGQRIVGDSDRQARLVA